MWSQNRREKEATDHGKVATPGTTARVRPVPYYQVLLSSVPLHNTWGFFVCFSFLKEDDFPPNKDIIQVSPLPHSMTEATVYAVGSWT